VSSQRRHTAKQTDSTADSKSAAGNGEGFAHRYPAVPASAAAARAALREFAARIGLSQAVSDAIALAVSEAVTNAIVHAYRDAAQPGIVEVAGVVHADELWVTVADFGSGLRPRLDSPGLGLGLAIIASAAEGLDLVQSAGGGVTLRMRFALGKPTDA
jgi:anti-sigma regulatory factor (Ser/Thr protein kinase)